MASNSLITELPVGYREEGIDASAWVNYLVLMIDNLKQGEPRSYSIVGMDLDKFLLNKDALRYLAAQNGVTLTFKRTMQVISLSALAEIENVDLLNPADTPDLFFLLKQGAIAIPMEGSEDSISDHYDAGYPIWTAQVNITGYKP